MRQAKTQISLGIHPVWSKSLLSAWRKLGSLATYWVHSEDSDQAARMPRLIWVFAGHTVILLFLSRGGSFKVGWLCWGLTSQSTIFQSCRDGAIASWVINQYFRGVKCLAQGHNTAAVGLEPRTSRSGVRHSTTEPPRSPKSFCHFATVHYKSESSLQNDVCLFWGFMAQSTLLRSCQASQLTFPYFSWAGFLSG